jgi:chromosome segregation protein
MGRADVIYGVTMQEFGVSKPVGVRMTTEDTKPTKSEDLQLEAQAAAEIAHHHHHEMEGFEEGTTEETPENEGAEARSEQESGEEAREEPALAS